MSIITFDLSMIDALKREALASPTKRARINLHEHLSDAIQEMVIAEHRSTYVRPHRHPGRLESFHVIEGLATVVIFDDNGEIQQAVPMGGIGSGRTILYRQRESVWHTVLVESEFFVVHEVVQGPFPYLTEWAPLCPAVDAPAREIESYMAMLRKEVLL